MEQIPMPILLDPQRPRLEGQLGLDDANQQAHDLEKALHQAADYGRHLWHQVDAVRHYLLEVAPDPDAPDEAARLFASPRGPDDDRGWDRWKTAYEAVTSVLAGPAGDSGFGRHEAAREELIRRGPVHGSDRTAELVQITAQRAAAVEQQRAATPATAPSLDSLAPDPPPSREPTGEAPPRSPDHPTPTPTGRAGTPPLPRSNIVVAGLIAAAAFAAGMLTRPTRWLRRDPSR